MFARDTLSYKPKPLPNRMQRSDTEMVAFASAHLAIMRQRHSVRDFDPRPVPRSIIEDCIKTAGLAPSGANHQPWHFAAIQSPRLWGNSEALVWEPTARSLLLEGRLAISSDDDSKSKL